MHHWYQQRRWFFATGTAGGVDTGGKFATGVNNTGGKFAAGINVANWLPLVLTTPAVLNADTGGILRDFGETDS